MKKLMLILTMVFTLACSSLCFAADGGDLNKEQRTAERFITALAGDAATEYPSLSAGFSADLNQKLGLEGYTNIQKQVKEKLGNNKSIRFVSFQRFLDGDIVSYIAEYSKEKNVAINFIFTKDGKLNDFSLTPIQPQPAPEQQPAAQK